MLGKIIIKIKEIIKQQTCIHEFVPDRIGIITGLSSRRICKKCGMVE